MGVGLRSQAEVPQILGRIFCPLHRPEQDIVNHFLLRLSLRLQENSLKLFRGMVHLLFHPVSQTGDSLGLSLEIEDHLRLRKVKIEGSPFHPSLTENPGQNSHTLQRQDDGLKPLPQLLIPIQQNSLHNRVGQPFMAMADAWIETISSGLTLGIISQLNRQGEPIYPGMKATDLVGELRRKHGNCPVREIDARSPEISLLVQ